MDHRPRASTDPTLLTGHAYRDDRPLAARQNLYAYQRPRFDLPGLVLEHVGDRDGVWVDVGCGNGRYLDRIRAGRPRSHVVGVDLSASLLRGVPGPVVCADAVHLPVRTGTADVVLTMHMLYHVPDPAQAAAEAARVLKSNGVLVASTNARDDKAELDQWWSQAAGTVLGTGRGPRRVKLSDHFPLDEAPQVLGRYFNDVTVTDLHGRIEVDSPGPLLAHYASYQAWADQAGVPFDQTLAQLEKDLRVRAEQGPLTVTTHQGLVVARGPRTP
ncbi:class I SAM-dependent methyltransferase [Thermobifida halotolerans]|uniref:Class I SAM-dependent methyltransferase n=1 Tax=Thermobifida halotolerans TaxID=483545 RepID=A0A399FUA2_9ACTN|nr:class I SAM-dependent methyltransferase [Thermobifida halotolerans]UOE21472.1 class I SAM-dependent methyltransferase [Thermobifida halotolerans]